MASRAPKRNASGRFQRCVASVSKRRGVVSPRGVCAAAGRAKYGADKFAAMAAAGKRKAAKKRNAGKKKPAAKMVKVMGITVREGTKKHARLVQIKKHADDLQRNTGKRKNSGGFGAIRVGSHVTIENRFGQHQKGRAVMRGPAGWVLNLGGAHGTPGIATPENVVKVSAPRKRKANRARRSVRKAYSGDNRKIRRARKAGATAKAEYQAARSYKRAYQTPGRGLHANRSKKNTGRKRATRKNSLEAAKSVYVKFHGRPAEKILDISEKMHVHDHLSGIGDLVGMQILQPNGLAKITLKFDDGSVLAQNEKRNQLFIRGGDQSVNLKDFGLVGPQHEMEVLGQLIWISYFTRKDHLAPEDGGEAIYKHKFGRKKPTVVYDTVNKKMELAGGGYDIPDEGIDR